MGLRVDCTGVHCPVHITRIESALEQVEMGESIEVLLDDDEEVLREVDAWCRVTGNAVVKREKTEDGVRVYIQRRV